MAGLRNRAKGRAKNIARRAGLDIRLYRARNSPEARRAQLLRRLGSTMVLDVGANIGQYATELRRSGFAGRIMSFEPLLSAFQQLSEEASKDDRWDVVCTALGLQREVRDIYVTRNLYSSSLLGPPQGYAMSAGDQVVGKEQVEVRSLDEVAASTLTERDRSHLKIDVQGAELEVLKGGKDVLAHSSSVELELSLIQIYPGQAGWREVVDHLDDAGFQLFGLDPVLNDPGTGRTLQVDGTFVKADVLTQLTATNN